MDSGTIDGSYVQVWPTWPDPTWSVTWAGSTVTLSRSEFESLIRENERLKIENEHLKQAQAKKR
jgi:hypothetical protein